MKETYFSGGVRVVLLQDKVLLLFNPEEPATPRSKKAFRKGDYTPVDPPTNGRLEGAIGCRDYLEIPRANKKKA